MADDLSDYVKRQINQQRAASVGAAQVVMGAADQTPDEAAGDMTLARDYKTATGVTVPPPLIKSHRLRFQDDLQKKRAESILSKSPKLTEWLRRPENAAIARDDLEPMSWFETALSAAGGSVERGVERVPLAYYQLQAAEASRREADKGKSFLGMVEEEISRPNDYFERALGFPIPDPIDVLKAGGRYLTSRMAAATGADDVANTLEYQRLAGEAMKRVDAIAMPPEADAVRTKIAGFKPSGDLITDLAAFSDIVAADPVGFGSFLTLVAAESLPLLAASGAAGLITRSPGIAAGFMGVGSGATEAGAGAAEFFQENGIDITTPEGVASAASNPDLMQKAAERGYTRGIIIGMLDGLSGGVAGQMLAKSPIGNMVLQSFAQAGLGAGGEASAQIFSGQEFNIAEVIIEGLAEFATAPLEVGTMAGSKFMRDRQSARGAENRKVFFEELSGNAQANKTRARMPDSFRDFLARATAEGPVESLYVDAEEFATYSQEWSGDRYALIDSIDGVTREDMDAALLSGGDIKIPTASYASSVAGSEHDAFMMENMRFDPLEMSSKDASEFNASMQDKLNEAVALADEVRQEQEALRSTEERIYNQVRASLSAAGRQGKVAETEALIYSSFYRAMAQRSGLTIEETLATYPLPEVIGSFPAGMQLRDIDEFAKTLDAARKASAKGKARSSLLDFISEYGGINDDGGELKARDATLIKRGRGRKNLRLARQETGPSDTAGRRHDAESVAQAAIEAGFLTDRAEVAQYLDAVRDGGEVPDITPLFWAAVDEELRGNRQFAPDATAEAQDAEINAQDDVEQYLASIGVTLEDDNETIRAAVEKSQDGQMYSQDGQLNTESEAFKLWFGDSKVVDGDGEPLVVYHGSPYDFDIFNNMSHFGTSVAASARLDSISIENEQYSGAIIPVYLRVLNPIKIEDPWIYRDNPSDLINELYEKDALSEDQADAASDAYREGNDQGNDVLGGYLNDNGFDGFVYTNDVEDQGSVSYVAFDPTQIKSIHNRGTFDANDPRILFQPGSGNARGSIQIPAGGVQSGQSIINLYQSANLSTFLHESGHYFLTVMKDMAETGGGPIAADFETIKTWWRDNAADVARDANKATKGAGVTADDVRAAIDAGTSGSAEKDAAIDVGMQEQFARGFERYLMEGRAPSIELRSAFEKFREWLKSIYRRVVNLNVEISDDIRQVMDRMLATDEEIAQAEADVGDTGPVFATAEQMGLSDEQYAAFLRLRRQAEDEAKSRLARDIMEPIQREKKKEYKAEKAKVLAEVTARIDGAPVYQALAQMGRRRKLSDADADDLAGWHGFDSGDALRTAIERAPPRREAIKAEVERIMYERHGDPLADGSVEVAALEAVHNDKRGEWLATELSALIDVAGTGARLTMKQARATARNTISQMKVRDAIASNRFLAAERKGAARAAELGRKLARDGVWLGNARRQIGTKARGVVRGDVRPGAVDRQVDRANASTEKYNKTVSELIAAKRRQLINHALYMESKRAAEDVAKAESYVRRLNKKANRDKIGMAGRRENVVVDYLAAIDDIQQRYDFRRLSASEEDRRGALNAYIEAMEAAGRGSELSIPEAVLARASLTPYKTVPMDELRGVIDSLKNLEHMAKRWNDLIDAVSQRQLDETVDGIVAEMAANMEDRPADLVSATRGERLREAGQEYLNIILNPMTLLREMDGFKDLGASYMAIKQPIDDAMDRLTLRRRKAAEDFKALYSVYTKEEQRAMGRREFVPALNLSMSKWDRISIALNAGNAGNLERLTNKSSPRPITKEQVQEVLDGLDVRDANFVQSVWNYLETFRADIAKREMRRTGVEPEWVEAAPVSVGGKMLTGGYFPLKYDPRLGLLQRDDDTQEQLKSLMSGRYGKAQTKNGHLKDRTGASGRAVTIDISTLHHHVGQVIYDLELSEPVANAWKILHDKRIRSEFSHKGRNKDFEALETWLLDVGTGEIRSAHVVERTARKMKSNFTAAKLAVNLSTVMIQMTGVAQSAVVIGKRNLLNGYVASMRPGVDAEISAKSTFMSERQTTFNKDIYDFYEDPKVGPLASRWGTFKQDVMGPFSFYLMTKVQWYTVDRPTWLGAYESGLQQFSGDDKKAVAYADQSVKRSQASGLFSDRSAIERGSLSQTRRQSDLVRFLFTTLGSYMFAKFNVAYERSVKARKEIAHEGVSGRSAVHAASWAIDMTLLFTVEAVLYGLIKGRWPDDDDDDDGWLEYLVSETAFGIMGTMPFIRDAASFGQGFEGGGAYGAVTKEIVSPFKQALQGEADRAAFKSLVNATGLATGIPSTQINRVIDAMGREIEGEDVAPLDYLIGNTSKK